VVPRSLDAPQKDPLYPPLVALRLGVYLSQQEGNEQVVRGTMAEQKIETSNENQASISTPPGKGSEQRLPVYSCSDPFSTTETVTDKSYSPSPSSDADNLVFDSCFESGNLRQAVRVIGRFHNRLCHGSSAEKAAQQIMRGKPNGLQEIPSIIYPSPVDQEYDLLCKNDTYTQGHIQWYFFSAKANKTCRVRFNITNMMKSDSLYNYGMKPTIYSTQAQR